MNGIAEADIMVDVPKSIFGRPRNARESRRNRQIQEMLSEKETATNHLFSFKMHPSKEPDVTETRPLPKCCKTCLPDAEMIIQEEMKHSGLVDCFIPPTKSAYNPFFIRKFPFYYHYSRCMTSSEMYTLPSWEELMNDTSLLKPFLENARNRPSTSEIEAVKGEVLEILCHLQVANVWKLFRKFFMRLSTWICQKYLSLHFESVLVHGGQIELLREVHSKKLPIIYVPTFRSKFDKVLIMWVLAHHGFRSPMFIRDHDSKNKFLKFFGGIGATLQVHADNQSEGKYSSAVSVYLRHLLRKGNNIILNLESGRTRTGRPSPNVYGTEFLKVIYDEYECNKIEDAYFVPVSVSYEILPDGKELFDGCQPVSLSPLSWIWALARGFFSRNPVEGKVKVDFAQPICFRELHNSLQNNVKVQRLAIGENDSYSRSGNCSYLRWNSSESLNSVSSLYGELAPLYPVGEDAIGEATLLDVINYHLLYDAGNCESVMPTHMVAFILMKKYRNGIYLEQLKDELKWLVEFIQNSKRDFGFAIIDCDLESIAYRAVELLKDDIICEWSDEKQTFRFTPCHETESLLKLEYYANYLLPIFMMESVIATAIFAMRGTAMSILKGFDVDIKIRDDEFIYNCRRVYEVVTGAFLLHPPCLSAESAIRKQAALMSESGLLTLVMRDVRRYNWEEYSDYEEDYPADTADRQREIVDQDYIFVPEQVKITTLNSTVNRLSFYRGLLIPYLEIFAYLSTCLEILLENDKNTMSQTDLEKHLLAKLIEVSEKDFSHCREVCSRTTLKQFLVTCEDHGILTLDSEVGSMNLVYKLLKTKDDLQRQADDILFYVSM